ncbi:MAG: ABC transporter ATP-binding protein [Thermoguttaceae bacterium]|jgi:lipopolysaccharide transport system ATP-binding protein|nr:ABC transporter ATP-binding protein [Thermoguttaceae bacterium]
MPDIAVRVENLSKQYRLGEFERYVTLRDSLARTFTRSAARLARRFRGNHEPSTINHQPDCIWALRDVSFEVPRGQVLGIIGRNGAGKSTLLKILSRITEPTSGYVEIHGRVGSLLEVGTGFHPELTGRENIFVNGAILGMSRAEIKRKFDEIVEFAGVEKFLDTPVKRYSSGMQVRLAFAVAAHLEPEILVVDEVLAVGDAAFQNKCIRKMEDVARRGRTVLFVSHNMAAVESLCTTAALLDAGKLHALGDVCSIISYYFRRNSELAADVDLSAHRGRVRGYSPILRRLRITDTNGNLVHSVPVGGDLVLEVELQPPSALPALELAIRFCGPRGERVFTCNTRYQAVLKPSTRWKGVARCLVRNCRLLPGLYHLVLVVLSNGARVDMIDSGLAIEVLARDVYGTGKLPPSKSGFVLPEVEWSFSPC